MKTYSRILKLVFSDIHKVIFALLLNVLATLFAIATFILIEPFMQLLFREDIAAVARPESFTFTSGSLFAWINYFFGDFNATYGKETTIIFILTFIFGIYLLKNIFSYLARCILVGVRYNAIRTLRNKIYHHILILPLSFFSEQKKGNIISKAINDVRDVDTTLLKSAQELIKEPIAIIVYMAALCFINLRLTIISLLLIPICGALTGKLTHRLRRRSFETKQQMGKIVAMAEESINGLRIIKSFNMIDAVNNNFIKANNRYTRLMNRVNRLNELASPLREFLGTLTVMIVLLIGSYMILSNHSTLTTEVFITYITICVLTITPSKNISNAAASVKKGIAVLDRIDDLLNEQERITEIEHPIEKKDFTTAITYNDVSFAYQTEPVLQHINLTIEKGKTIAICGHSGSGKSTLVDLLPRFYDCTEGEIQIDGIPIKHLKITDLRALFGIVSQESLLFNDTIYNNITLGNTNFTKEAVITAAKAANAYDFIMQTEHGFDTQLGDRGMGLSGGQRQRLSIARAVLYNCPILILDEATSALDTTSEHLVQESLDSLMKGKTSIVIAHRLSTIRNADEIILLQHGKITDRGTHAELYAKNNTYHAMVDMQSLK